MGTQTKDFPQPKKPCLTIEKLVQSEFKPKSCACSHSATQTDVDAPAPEGTKVNRDEFCSPRKAFVITAEPVKFSVLLSF